MLRYPEDYAVAAKVNAEVNFETQYKTDLELYGLLEFWTVANGAGDCDDYALAKRQRLLAAGWPVEKLRLACVFTETSEGRQRLANKRAGGRAAGDHAVLVVSTSAGDFILDNRFDRPMLLSETGYDLDRIQVAGSNEWEEG